MNDRQELNSAGAHKKVVTMDQLAEEIEGRLGLAYDQYQYDAHLADLLWDAMTYVGLTRKRAT